MYGLLLILAIFLRQGDESIKKNNIKTLIDTDKGGSAVLW